MRSAKTYGAANNAVFEQSDVAKAEQKVDKILYIVTSSDRGLCGGIHSSVSKFTKRDIESGEGQGKDVTVIALGEKPKAEDAPSNLAIIGRYVLSPAVFEILERTQPGKGGEIQLTDALQELAADPDGPGVYGVIFRGRRYDTGDRVDYIKAIVQLAADRDDLGPDLRPWFKEFAAKL